MPLRKGTYPPSFYEPFSALRMGWLRGWVRVGTLLQEFRQRGVAEEEEEDVGRGGEEEDGEGGICVP